MIRKAAETDRASLAKLAAKLWGNHSEEKLSAEISGLLLLTGAAFFLTEEDRQPVEVAQCQLRHDYVEGGGFLPGGISGRDLYGRSRPGERDRRRPPCPVRKLGKRKGLHRICQ